MGSDHQRSPGEAGTSTNTAVRNYEALTSSAIGVGLVSFLLGVAPISTASVYWAVPAALLLLVGLVGALSIGLSALHSGNVTWRTLTWYAAFEGQVAAGIVYVAYLVNSEWTLAGIPMAFCEGDGCFSRDGWGFPAVFAIAAVGTVTFLVFAVRSFIGAHGVDRARRAYGITRGVFRMLEAGGCLLALVAPVVPMQLP